MVGTRHALIRYVIVMLIAWGGKDVVKVVDKFDFRLIFKGYFDNICTLYLRFYPKILTFYIFSQIMSQIGI